MNKTIIVAIVAVVVGFLAGSLTQTQQFAGTSTTSSTIVAAGFTTAGNISATGSLTTGSLASGSTVVDAFTEGGSALSTTTTSTSFGTLTAAQLIANSVITLTPNVSSATSTMPATSTMTALLTSTGDTRSWTLLNGTSTSAITVGIAAGTGIALTSNTLNNVQIQPDGAAQLTCVRLATTDLACRVDISVEAD